MTMQESVVRQRKELEEKALRLEESAKNEKDQRIRKSLEMKAHINFQKVKEIRDVEGRMGRGLL